MGDLVKKKKLSKDLRMSSDKTWIHSGESETKQQSAFECFNPAVLQLKHLRTVNTDWYANSCLPVATEIRKKR